MKWMPGVGARSLRPGDCLDRDGDKPTREDVVVTVEGDEADTVRVVMAGGKDYLLSGELMVPIWRAENETEKALAMLALGKEVDGE